MRSSVRTVLRMAPALPIIDGLSWIVAVWESPVAIASHFSDLSGAAANQTGFMGITQSAGAVLLLHKSNLCTTVTVSVLMPGLAMLHHPLCLIRG